MSFGPIELVVLRFADTDFRGEVLKEIQKAVDAGVIRVVDILLAVRAGDEAVRVLELAELEHQVLQRFEPVVSDVTRLLSDADAVALSADLGPDSAVALLVFEHVWVAPVADAIERTGGAVVMTERIPRAVIEELVAQASA